MYKVAILTHILHKPEGCGKQAGGGSVVLSQLIAELSKNPEIELCVFAIKNHIDTPVNYKIVEINDINGIDDYFEKAHAYIENEAFDIVLTVNIQHIFKNNFLQCHSFIHRCKNAGFLISPIKRLLSSKKIRDEKQIFEKIKKDTAFIAVSETIKKDYSLNYNISAENIKVVYPGCKKVYDTFPKSEKKDIPTLSTVANASVNKGGHFFIFAAGIAKLLGAKFKIHIIAPKYNRDILMKAMVLIFGIKNNIKVFDRLENMHDFYKATDILVLPSFNEAFGLVVLEAASYAKPSIVSSSAGVSELITESNGFIFNIHSLFSLASAIRKVCNLYTNNYDSYLQYAQQAYNLSLKYNWQKFAQEVIKK